MHSPPAQPRTCRHRAGRRWGRRTAQGQALGLRQGPGLAAAAADHILRRHRPGQNPPGHPADGGGVKQIPGEKPAGGCWGRGGSLGQQAAPAGIPCAKLHVVAHQHNGRTGLPQVPEQGGQNFFAPPVQALGGLVQQQDLGPGQQHLSQGGPLLLPAGQVVGMPVQQVPHPAELGHLLHLGRIPTNLG